MVKVDQRVLLPSGLRGRWGSSLDECRRLLDLANRLTYWRFTGDDRAFIAPGPWRTHETEQT